jgi:hypothetical protein
MLSHHRGRSKIAVVRDVDQNVSLLVCQPPRAPRIRDNLRPASPCTSRPV